MIPPTRARTSAAMSVPTSLVVVFFIFFSLLGSEPVALAQTSPPPQQRLVSAVELAALYSLRASLGLRSRDWPRKADPCASWAGVQCRGGRVVALELASLRRTRVGRVAPLFAVDGIRNLTRLSNFNASGFALPGPIPDWFGATSLTVLDLRRCSVSGAIPDSLGSAAGLAELHLSGNSLTGRIPTTLGNISKLAVLDLSGNALSGPVPASLGFLRSLTYLDLSSNLLTGAIPPQLGMLSSLMTLRISNNRLLGPVPPQLGDLSSLVTLDLSLNSLSGSIPGDLKSLRSLQELDVKNNNLSGPLPADLFLGLLQLRSLSLSHNDFSGALPDSLWALSELRSLNVSYNNFSGGLPGVLAHANASSGVLDMSHNSYYGSLLVGEGRPLQRFGYVDISDNYFEGQAPASSNSSFGLNCFSNALNQRSLDNCKEFYAARGLAFNGTVTPSKNTTNFGGDSSGKSDWRTKYILAAALGGTAFVVILVVVAVCCVMRQGAAIAEQSEVSANAVTPEVGAPPVGIPVNSSAVGDSFTYEQMLQATSHFSETKFIKHGHSGDLYCGSLEGGAPVVVKRIDLQMVKKDSYLIELDFLAKASHTRLVPFLGHCLEKDNEKLLVYKYMPNGDLSNSLYRKTVEEEESLQSLDWIKRLKIAIGIAEALCYLHHECSPPFVHRDIQSSSILLDDKFEVRLGSLGEVCTQEGDANQNVITKFLRKTPEQGTSGSNSASCAHDVYCLGKVLLELVTGELGISGSSDASTNEWLERTLPCINIYEKELVMKILDPSLIVDDDLLEEVWAMAIVAKSCLNPKPSRRPLVRYILKALENPLRVVREDHSNSARLRTRSSLGSWNAALFGSWRQSSSDIVSISGPARETASFKHSATAGSQGSVGEQSFNQKRPRSEIFPEPFTQERHIEK